MKSGDIVKLIADTPKWIGAFMLIGCLEETFQMNLISLQKMG